MSLPLSLALLALGAGAAAAQEERPYRTPRAGEGFETELFGSSVTVPRRDRRSTRALTLGGAFFSPPLVDNNATPLFNLYWLRYWRNRRIYALFSGAYNRVEYGEHLVTFGRGQRRGVLEALLIEENFTIPTPLVEATDEGREAPGSEVWWGRISLDAGLGLRARLAPHGVDNDVRLQLLGRAEWDYFAEDDAGDDQTDPGAIIPHDTLVYGGRLVLRFDALERNLLELPHLGVAAGGAVDLLRRADWREPGLRGPDGARTAPPGDTRDILRLTSYLYVAFGAPQRLLSEKHRLIAQVHAGWAPPGTVDRFSAFRLGTGPLQSEANDLARASYPGASFEQLTAERYVMGSLTYRYEVLFFLFVHARVVAAWARVGEWDPAIWGLRFRERAGFAYCAGLTSGFAFKSQLSVEYSYDDGFARDGRDGHGVLFIWSKSF